MPTSNENDSVTIDDYCERLYRKVLQLTRRTRSNEVAQDVAQSEVLKFLSAPLQVMREFPVPENLAAARSRFAVLNWERSERIQRSQGSRLVRDENGGVCAGRTWLSGNEVVGTGELELFEMIGSDQELPEERVVNRLAAKEAYRVCAGGLRASDLELLLRSDGGGTSITELAREAGCARETLSRRASAARSAARRLLDAQNAG